MSDDKYRGEERKRIMEMEIIAHLIQIFIGSLLRWGSWTSEQFHISFDVSRLLFEQHHSRKAEREEESRANPSKLPVESLFFRMEELLLGSRSQWSFVADEIALLARLVNAGNSSFIVFQ